MTKTIPHVVNRFVIDTDDTFDDVRQRYESLVPTLDFAELSEVIATGDFARVQQYTAEQGLSRPLLKFSGGSGDILRDVLC